MIKNKAILLYLISISTLLGCASSGVDIREDYDMSKYPDKSIVFGVIQVKGGGGIPTLREFSLTKEGKLIANQPFSQNEYFFIILDPGEYWIEEINLGHGLPGLAGFSTYLINVHERFTIDNSSEVIYIGKLLVEITTVPSPFTRLNYKRTVLDEYDLTVNEFRKRYPNIKKEIKKNLMQ